MKTWKKILFCAVASVIILGVAAPVQAQRGGRSRNAMTDDEREDMIRASAPLVAKAIAEHLKLSKEAGQKFSEALAAELVAAEQRMAEGRQLGGRARTREASLENSRQMAKLLRDNLTAEQAKKAQALLGRNSTLDSHAQSLVMSKVETKKIEKALPKLVEYALAQQDLDSKMSEETSASDKIAEQSKALHKKLVKDLTSIVDEEAAKALPEPSGRGRGRNGGEEGQEVD